MSGQRGPDPSSELDPESLLDPNLEPAEQKRLDDLVAGFEDDMRRRPTPMELDEEDGAGKARPKRKRSPAASSVVAPAAAGIAGADPAAGGAADASSTESAAAEAEMPMLPFGEPPSGVAATAPSPSVPAAEPAPAAAQAPAPVDNQPASAAAAATVAAPGASIEAWWAGGDRVRVDVPSGAYEIFTRTAGEGPWLTLVHGFPTSSFDWAPMVEAMSKKYRLLMFDLLGFGDSDKPAGHDWSAFEQADIIEALWRHFGVEKTRVLAHDVGDTVTLELISRRQEGKLATELQHVTLLNGGIYSGFHRPRPIQVWLQRPVVGALIARMLSEGRFGPALAEVFGPAHQPSDDELHQHWLSVARRNGSRSYHRLIKYIPERRARAERWESALDATDVPLKFVWGMVDPVSGAHMIEVVRDRRRGANIVELADVGHYPQLEAPADVARAVLG